MVKPVDSVSKFTGENISGFRVRWKRSPAGVLGKYELTIDLSPDNWGVGLIRRRQVYHTNNIGILGLQNVC